MNINRNNYETFFLMYVDNELSAAERQAVDAFIQENTDLAEELHLLQQTILPNDNFVFEAKNNLLKEEHTALQESLMLYMDGELDDAAKKEIEVWLNNDAAAAKEYAVLQQTQLNAADTIIFPNKNILYRKEPGRVVAFNWRRIAVAAILLGFGTWGTLAYLQNGNKPVSGPVTANRDGSPNNNIATVNTGNKETHVNAGTTKQEAATTAAVVETPSDVKTAAGVAKQTTVVPNAAKKTITIPVTHTPENDNNAVAQKQDLKQPSNNLPKPDYNNFNKEDRNKTAIAIVTPSSRPNVETGSVTTAQPVNHTNAETEVTGYALNTKYNETDGEQEENTNKKSKLGNLFRKVKRMVERTTNTPSGNGVKIATFDIAIK